MRVLNAVQRIVMLLLLIPVLIIILDALLAAFGAREGNVIVKQVDELADTFMLRPLRNVFPKQTDLQDAIVTLAALGLLVLVVVFVFRALRSVVGSKPPKPRPAPAPKPKKTTETVKSVQSAPSKPAPADTAEPSATASAGTPAPGSKTEAPVSTGAAGGDDETHPPPST